MTATEVQRELEQTETLQDLWHSLIPKYQPAPYQFTLWLRRYGFDALRWSIERTARKLFNVSGNMDAEYLMRYCASVAKSRQEQGR